MTTERKHNDIPVTLATARLTVSKQACVVTLERLRQYRLCQSVVDVLLAGELAVRFVARPEGVIVREAMWFVAWTVGVRHGRLIVEHRHDTLVLLSLLPERTTQASCSADLYSSKMVSDLDGLIAIRVC